MGEENKVKYGVVVEDAVVTVAVEARVDIIEILEEMAKNTSNTIDDKLITLVKLARDKADWEGYAKEHII